MLPDAHVVKIGGRSILDAGRGVVYPVVETLARILATKKLILGVGGGVRTRHVFSIGLDLGLPTGVLAQLSAADANGNAHILGTLLAPYGVVAIPPEMFGHLLPLFIQRHPASSSTACPRIPSGSIRRASAVFRRIARMRVVSCSPSVLGANRSYW